MIRWLNNLIVYIKGAMLNWMTPASSLSLVFLAKSSIIFPFPTAGGLWEHRRHRWKAYTGRQVISYSRPAFLTVRERSDINTDSNVLIWEEKRAEEKNKTGEWVRCGCRWMNLNGFAASGNASHRLNDATCYE